MSALATRMLVLGVVRIFEPANAYGLRRELLSWQVDQWAHLGPGSIYGMLASLEKAGLVRRSELTGVNGRPVSVYATTEEGAAEFPRLIDRGLRDAADSADVVDLRASLALMPFLSRERASSALEARMSDLGVAVAAVRAKQALLAETGAAPPHVVEGLGLEVQLADAQLRWLRGYRDRIEAGEMEFAGEGPGWTPPADDPGHAMQRDRLHYLAQLSASP